MRSQTEIEQSIQNNLPIVFGKSESVNPSVILKKSKKLIDYLTDKSASVLTTETIRYQSILLYVSLLFLSVSLFRIDKFLLGGSPVVIDRKFFAIYSVFIAMVAVIFRFKAWVDTQRTGL